MAIEPPYPINDNPHPDDTTAWEAKTILPPADQSTASAPEISPETKVDPTSAIPTPSDSGMAAVPPYVAPDSAPEPAASFGPKSVRGGNMAMRVLSRAIRDFEADTGGTVAATYEQVDHYVGNAIRIEQELERAALSAMTGQPGKNPGPVSGTMGRAGGDPGISQHRLESAGSPSTINIRESPATAARGQAPPEPTESPDFIASFGGFKGGKKVPGDFFQFTQDMLRTEVSHHDAANGIGKGYFKDDQSDVATAAEIAKSTIEGARLRNDIEDFNLVSSAQYFENLAREDSPYKDQYELIATILKTKIALDTARLDQKVGHEAQQYGIFFGQVARQVSAPVDAVITIKDLADGKISPAEAAVSLATLGHGHLLASVERMTARGAGKKITEKVEETLEEPPKPKSEAPDEPPSPKPRLPTRENIIEDVQTALKPHLDTIKNIDPEAKVGFRGSLASGTKGEHKGDSPFDPNDFDVDALIVSDKLAEMIKTNRRKFRSGSKHEQLRRIQLTIDKSLRSNPIFSGLRTKDPFTFRIYSTREMQDLLHKERNNKSFSVIYTE